ncbi:MAG: hypothetical protein WEA31_09140 [Pirellulales bacterium]
MRQAELNREVARLTGESVATIKRLGFLLADPCEPCDESDPADEAYGPYVIDWDELEAERQAGGIGRPCHEPVAA